MIANLQEDGFLSSNDVIKVNELLLDWIDPPFRSVENIYNSIGDGVKVMKDIESFLIFFESFVFERKINNFFCLTHIKSNYNFNFYYQLKKYVKRDLNCLCFVI